MDSAQVLHPFTLWLTEKEDNPSSPKMVRDTEDKGPGDKTRRANSIPNQRKKWFYFTNNQGNNVKKAFDGLKALTSAVEIASI